MTNPFLIARTQSADAGQFIELFTIDATILGDTVYRFTQSQYETKPVSFGGTLYKPEDVVATGFERTGQGTTPRPQIKVSNVTYPFGPLLAQHQDGLRAQVTRIKTLRDFLDGEAHADPGAYLQLDVFTVERKVSQNKRFIAFELAAPYDAEGVMLPRRQCLRDICSRVPRTYDPVRHVFVNPQPPLDGCPYIDLPGYPARPLYDANGLPVTDPAKEVFSKQLNTCCKVRFPGGPYPTRAFPGMARTHA